MKIQSIFVLLGIIILTVITIIGGVKSCSKETPTTKTGRVITQPKWKLCWGNNISIKRCGSVKKIKFDKSGEILFVKILFTTGVTTNFSRNSSKKRGRWSQSSGGGWWTLKKISPGYYKGQCQGEEKGDKIRQLILTSK